MSRKSDRDSADRALPSNLEAERAVLAAVILNGDVIHVVAGILQPAEFFRDAHQKIYRTMLDMAEQRQPLDFVILKNALDQNGLLADVGGPAYLSGLTDGFPGGSNIEYYAGIVADKARLRGVIQAAAAVQARAYAADESGHTLAAQAADQLQDLAAPPREVRPLRVGELLTAGIESIERSQQSGGITGVRTGFLVLDDLTAGLQPEDLILLAARPSQGKTALAMNIARHVGKTDPVLVCSMEMSRQQLFLRLLASEAMVDSHKMRMGWLHEKDWPRISTAMNTLDTAKIWIDDTPRLSVADVRRRALRVKSEVGLSLIVIDYLQLMKGPGENRTQEVGGVSRGLKALAREFKVPILALCQLNRDLEGGPKRAARKPQLSDLRESGDLEADADVVIMIHREAAKDGDQGDTVLTDLLVRKQRNGPVGEVRVHWSKEYVRFDNPDCRPCEILVLR